MYIYFIQGEIIKSTWWRSDVSTIPLKNFNLFKIVNYKNFLNRN